MKKLLILIAFFNLSSLAALAQPTVTACIWKPFTNSTRFLVPVIQDQKKSVDCKNAVQKYVDAVNADSDLRSMMNGATLPISAESTSEIFKSITKQPRPQFIVNANEFSQVSDPADFTMTNISQKLSKAGADVIALPVAADLALNADQRLQFHELIAKHFDAMMSLGGQDINPALYKQNLTTAHREDVHVTRDAHESRVIDSYIKLSRGVFYAICRGHQLAAVTQGQKLYQDIYTEDIFTPKRTSTPHTGGTWHPISLDPKSILLKWVYTDLVDGKNILWVNSFHHQAVAYPLKTTAGLKDLIVTGFEQDDVKLESHKIIEVIESLDGRYITMQFHPEGMDEDQHDNGSKIMDGMVRHAQDMRP